MPDCEKANSYQRMLTIEFLAAKFYRMSNKNPPPEGVVLSLPLKGDENTFRPLRGRGVVSGFVI